MKNPGIMSWCVQNFAWYCRPQTCYWMHTVGCLSKVRIKHIHMCLLLLLFLKNKASWCGGCACVWIHCVTIQFHRAPGVVRVGNPFLLYWPDTAHQSHCRHTHTHTHCVEQNVHIRNTDCKVTATCSSMTGLKTWHLSLPKEGRHCFSVTGYIIWMGQCHC